MPGDHRWPCIWQEQTSQNCLTPPSEVKNRQFYARKKRQSLNRLAAGHQCSVKTHDKAAFRLHLANPTARIPAGVKKLHRPNRALYPTSLPSQREIRSRDTQFLKAWWEKESMWHKLSIFKTVQSGNVWYHFTTFCKEMAMPLSSNQYRKNICLYRTNVWHDSVCCNGFI